MAWYRCGGGGNTDDIGLHSIDVNIQTAEYTSSPLEEEQNGNS